MPSLFCEQPLEVGSIAPGATCITGVGVGDGGTVGDGGNVGEGVGEGDGGKRVGEGDGMVVGGGDNVGDGDGGNVGVGVAPDNSVSVTGMATFPPFDDIWMLAELLPICRLLFVVSTVT